jgi:hypothetical protein
MVRALRDRDADNPWRVNPLGHDGTTPGQNGQ